MTSTDDGSFGMFQPWNPLYPDQDMYGQVRTGGAAGQLTAAHGHVDLACQELIGIPLDLWRGSAADAARSQQSALSAQLSSLSGHINAATVAANIQEETATRTLVCAATTGVY